MESRLEDIEVKLSFAQHLLDELNDIVVRQQQEIEQLRRDIALLREQVEAAAPADRGGPRDETPPHY